MALSEKELIRQAQAGDADAFGALYEKYADPVYRFVYWKTRHRETAEDITARVFMKALEAVGSLEPSESAFRPWVYTIARNAVTDHWRTHRQHADIEDAWDIAADDDVARDAEARMRLEKVRGYLEQLDAVQRDVVLLRVWHDLPYADIARIVGKSPDNCKVIFSRAVKRMRADVGVLLALTLLRFHM